MNVCDGVRLSCVCQMSIQFVESVLHIHGKYSELVESVFNADLQFYGALDKVITLSSFYVN